MFDASSLAEFDDQHVELLPARTVLSLFIAKASGDGSPPALGSLPLSSGSLPGLGGGLPGLG